MSSRPIQLDLSLWKDKELIIRQNQLKGAFWEIFSEIGNSSIAKELCKVHSPNKGVKLTKGNDLLGFPYHVLDLIRDFESKEGLNFRILNWFGHGMFLFVLFGKEHLHATSHFFTKNGFYYALTPTPWDYPEQLLSNIFASNPDSNTFKKSTYHQWFKEIHFEGSSDCIQELEAELKKISDFFTHRVG
jgi:hypothetical protein